MLAKRVLLTAIAIVLAACSAEAPSSDDALSEEAQSAPAGESGLDVLEARFASSPARVAGQIDLRGKRIALVVNQTAVTVRGKHAIDVFRDAGLDVVKIFAPEHGARGEAEAGVPVTSGRDRSGVPLVSLYGSKKKPSREDLADVDLVFFDIQDVGARFYTFVSTLGLVMEAAAEQGKTMFVLDRPNLTGSRVDGPVLDPRTLAARAEDRAKGPGFVGMYPVPIEHGMTVGELATYVKGEGLVAAASSLTLHVVRSVGYARGTTLAQQRLYYAPSFGRPAPGETTPLRPSPNLRSENAILLYPGTCLLEGTSLSEGRGTDAPFEVVGAPWITGDLGVLAATVKAHACPSATDCPIGGRDVVSVTPAEVVPSSNKYAGLKVRGLALRVTDPKAFRAVPLGVAILTAVNRLYRKDLQWAQGGVPDGGAWLRALWGSDGLRLAVERPEADLARATTDLMTSLGPARERFLATRTRYLFPEYSR